MKRKTVWIGGLIALFFVLLLSAPLFVSEESYKAAIIREVNAVTGRELTLGGKMRLHLLPTVGVDIQDVALSGLPNARSKEDMITLKSLRVSISPWTLLSGGIEVRSLTLDEPVIRLRVDSDGVRNWEFPAGEEPEKPRKKIDRKAARQEGYMPSSLSLSDVRIVGGTVLYANDIYHTEWSLTKVNAGVELEGLASPLALHADAVWNDQKVTFKGSLGTLESLLHGERSTVDAVLSGGGLIKAELKGGFHRGMYDGDAHVQAASLKQVAGWLAPKMELPAHWPKLAFDMEGKLQCALTSCSVTQGTLALDAIKAQGSLKTTLTGDIPQFDLDLTTAALDLNPYLEPKEGKAAGLLIRDAAAEAAPWSDEPIDLRVLRTLNFSANIRADGVLFRSLRIGKALLRAKIQRGRLGADVVDAAMYGGKGNITLNVDTMTMVPSFETRSFFKDVLIEPLLKDAAGITWLSGTGDLQINTLGQGRTQRAIVSTLSGGGQLKLRNGVIRGVSLSSLAASPGASAGLGDGQKTDVNTLSASFTIARGVLNNHDLTMGLPNLRIAGEGEVDLPAYSVRYRLTPQIVSGENADRQGLAVPILVSGSLAHPTLRADAGSVIRDAIEDPKKFREELKNSRGALKEQLGQQMKDPKQGLNNLKGMLKGLER